MLVAELTLWEAFRLYVMLHVFEQHFRRHWWRTWRVWRWKHRRHLSSIADFTATRLYLAVAETKEREFTTFESGGLSIPSAHAALIATHLEHRITYRPSGRSLCNEYLDEVPGIKPRGGSRVSTP